MGLDQNLYASKYQSISRSNGNEQNQAVRDIIEFVGATGFTSTDPDQYIATEVKITVASWRKANQIHAWFVDEVQYGEDDGHEHHVQREQLAELVSLCQSVLDNRGKASELLPADTANPLGSGDFSEWYYGQLADTAETISRLLATVPEDWHFSYAASY